MSEKGREERMSATDTTNNYRCTKCRQPCDPAYGGQVVITSQGVIAVSLCCRAPVQVQSAPAGKV